MCMCVHTYEIDGIGIIINLNFPDEVIWGHRDYIALVLIICRVMILEIILQIKKLYNGRHVRSNSM